MKFLLTFILLFSFSLSVRVIDFGEFGMRDVRRGRVVLYNTGDAPLVVKGVDSGCVCTKVRWDKRPVLAGDSTVLEVTYAPNERGVFYKTVTVSTSQGEPQKFVVRGRVL